MSVLGTLDRLAYRTQQLSWLVQGTVFQGTARAVTRQPRPDVPREVLEDLQRRYRQLLDHELANVEAGLYPRELLFQIPFAEYARALPQLLRDAPRIVKRIRSQNFRDLPREVDLERYPRYYRRNFHWQTDGYLSERSAAIYDLGVELLFLGTADIMRRQIIPPIARFLQDLGDVNADTPPKLLDVACGTGRVLHQLSRALPQLRLSGIDLSPFYVRQARRLLGNTSEVSLSVENAESLPYRDNHFDVLTCVYLFHELPKDARRRVLNEMYRVLRPGGLLVVEDSTQLSDSPALQEVLDNFSTAFHEPYYKGYVRDDLAAMLRSGGFVEVQADTHMVAKVVSATKPLH